TVPTKLWHALVALRSGTAGERLYQPVEIFISLVERLHRNPLILAVGAEIADLVGEARVAIGRYPRIAEIAAIGGTRAHDRHHHRAWPEFMRQLLDRTDDLLVEF